jgi:3-oxoacyl-[acyl-carrier protein] reductase
MQSSRAHVIAFGIVSTREGGDTAVAAGAGVTGPAYDPGMNGRIALVTGAGSGLGAAITRRLAADGAHLIVNDLNADAAAKVAADVGGEAAPFDVTDSRAFTAAVDGVVERHGRIDVLVNNAGIVHDRPEVRARSMANMAARMEGREIEPVSATSTLTDEQWDLMIKTHLYGTFYGTRAALRHMEPVRSGAIVNLASIYGIVGSAGTPDYSAAKGAIVLFTKSVGREVAPLGIRVNAVAPGFIDTPLLAPMADMRGMLEMQIPSGRLGEADEVANLVRFLAGDEASYCFGDVLTLTGGYSI